MALVNMRDMIYHAYKHNYAVGAFDLSVSIFSRQLLAPPSPAVHR